MDSKYVTYKQALTMFISLVAGIITVTFFTANAITTKDVRLSVLEKSMENREKYFDERFKDLKDSINRLDVKIEQLLKAR